MDVIVDTLIRENNGTMWPGTNEMKHVFTLLPRIPGMPERYPEEDVDELELATTQPPITAPSTTVASPAVL